jgi:hypothetical protein
VIDDTLVIIIIMTFFLFAFYFSEMFDVFGSLYELDISNIL